MKKSSSSAGRYVLFAVSCYLIYFLYAMFINSNGSSAGNSMAFFGINATQQGLIITMRTAGILVMVFILTLLGDRVNSVHALGVGTLGICALLGAQFAVVRFIPAQSAYLPYLGCTFLLGFCTVTLATSMNSIMMGVFAEKENIFLPLMHAFFGLGAVLSPILFSRIIRAEMPSDFIFPTATAIGLLVALAIYFPLSRKVLWQKPGKSGNGKALDIFCHKLSWLIIGTTFFASCFEGSMIAWLPTYLKTELGMNADYAGTITAAFFGGYLTMRLTLPLLLNKFKPSSLFVSAVLINIVLTGVFFMLPEFNTVSFLLLLLSGACTGASSPLLYLFEGQFFPGRPASAAGIITMAMNAATGVAPLISGAVADYLGYRAAMYASIVLLVPALFFAGMLIKRLKNMPLTK